MLGWNSTNCLLAMTTTAFYLLHNSRSCTLNFFTFQLTVVFSCTVKRLRELYPTKIRGAFCYIINFSLQDNLSFIMTDNEENILLCVV